MLCFSHVNATFQLFFQKSLIGWPRICLSAKVCNLVFIIVHCSYELIVWLINWKLHFLEWKTRSFVLKFSPQNTENHIFRTWNFKIFRGGMHLDWPHPPPRRGDQQPLVTQSVTLSEPMATSIFIETPDYWKVQIRTVNKDRTQKRLCPVIQDKQIFPPAT